MKSVVIVSDLHCGSVYGITPPEETKEAKHKASQNETWNEYVRITRQWAKPDILICNGDAIEGNQKKQGGAEVITPDRTVQCDIAVRALEMWKAGQTFLTYGTGYHVGPEAEDYERTISDRLGGKIEGHLYLNIEGLVFDIRHKVGTSSIPHGRATAILKELMWALVKEANETGPKVDVVVRSHAHYSIQVESPGKLAIVTPGLQLARGRFGARECSGDIHWGAIRLIINNGKIIRKDTDICRLQSNRPKVFRIA